MRAFVLVAAVLVAGAFANNLIQNQNAEAGTSSWTSTTGALTQFAYGGASGWPDSGTPGSPNRGLYFFSGGNHALSVAHQNVDMTTFTSLIDDMEGEATLSAYIGGYLEQNDRADIVADFFDGSGTLTGRMQIGPVYAWERSSITGFMQREKKMRIPFGTRSAKVTITCTRESGAENSGYVDDISLTVSSAGSILSDHVSNTFAGTGIQNIEDSTDNSPATLASPFDLVKITAGPYAGNFMFTDSLGHIVRLLEWNGRVTIFGGAGLQSGDTDGNFGENRFNSPRGIVHDSNGIFFIADFGNSKVRGMNDGRYVLTWASLPTAPTHLAINSANILYAAAGHKIYKIAGQNNVVTLAGGNDCAHVDAFGVDARFCNLGGLAVDANGHLVVADSGNHRIRMVSVDGWAITLSGDGTAQSADGPKETARWNAPAAVAIDSENRYYITSRGDHSVRLLANGEVLRLAGGAADFVDGNPLETRFNQPEGLHYEGGTMYVCDYANFRIRQFTPMIVRSPAGQVSPGYGDYPNAMYNGPYDVLAVRDQLMIADTFNHRIAYGWYYGEIFGSFNYLGSTGGYVDGPAQNALFEYPLALAWENEVLYIADWRSLRRFAGGTVRTISQLYGIQKLCVKDGWVRMTVANRVAFMWGDQYPAANPYHMAGSESQAGHADGNGGAALFNGPKGITIDRNANHFVADSNNFVIRKITNSFDVSTVAGIVGQAGSNDGTVFQARFMPYGITVKPDGALIVTGTDHNVRLISGQHVSTIAGLGRSGSVNGDAKDMATFNTPRGVAVLNGNIHIADTSNNQIRALQPKKNADSPEIITCSSPGFTTVDGYNAIISDSNGHFAPDVQYANDENCDYTITCPVSKAVQLVTIEGGLDPDTDHVSFYDSGDKRASYTNKLKYGVENPVKPFYQAHGYYLQYLPIEVQATHLNEVLVKFVSNSQRTATGFTLKYECVDQPAAGGGLGDPICYSNDNAMFECNFHGEAIWATCGTFHFHVRAERPAPAAVHTEVTGLAVRKGSDTCVVTRAASTLPDVYCNGNVVTTNSNHGALTVAFDTARILTITASDGNKVLINMLSETVAFVYDASAACQGTVTGLGGNFNFDPNDDFVSRNGLVTTPKTAPSSQIYADFVKTWLITLSAQSMFASFTTADLGYTPAFGTANTVANCPNYCLGNYECCFAAEVASPTVAQQTMEALAWRNFVLSPHSTLPPENQQVCFNIQSRCVQMSELCVCNTVANMPANFCTDFIDGCLSVFGACQDEVQYCLEQSAGCGLP